MPPHSHSASIDLDRRAFSATGISNLFDTAFLGAAAFSLALSITL